MNWILLSIACALSETIKDVTSKKIFHEIDEYVCSLSATMFALPWLYGCTALLESAHWSYTVLWVAPLAAGLHILALVLYFRAIRTSDLSLVLPLVAFTPAFFLGTSPLLIGEYASAGGAYGIVLIVFGSYILYSSDRKNGWLAPFRSLIQDGGARAMLGTAFIWSVTGNLDRIGLRHCSPFLWFAILLTVMSLGLILIAWRYSTVPAATLRRRSGALLTIGFFHASSTVFYQLAISSSIIAYVVSLKRLSVVFSVLWGLIALGERNFKQRFPAALCMLAGVLLIALTG